MKKNGRMRVMPSGHSYPVVETEEGSVVWLNRNDVLSGQRNDPDHCAIAQSCMRAMGAIEVQIGKEVAYVVKKFRGEYVAMKFSVPARTSRAIRNFDQTGLMPDEGFILKHLKPSDGAARKKERNRTRDQNRTGVPRATQPKDAPRLITRSLSGRVQTRSTEDDEA